MPDNESHLKSVLRIIKRSANAKRFSLIFAVCDSLRDQNRYVQTLNTECDKLNITLTEIALLGQRPIDNLRETIESHIERTFQKRTPEKMGIQVTGLELSILLDPNERAPAVLQMLNIGREGFWKYLPYPVVVWLPEFACKKIATIAPDFWSVRDGSYVFSSEQSSEIVLQDDIREDSDINEWRDKRAQIPILERTMEWISAAKIDTPPEIFVDLLLKSGDANLYVGRTEIARKRFEEALENAHRIQNLEREAAARNRLGLIYSDEGGLKKAVEFIERFIEIGKIIDRPDFGAGGYNLLGLVYDRHKRFEQAIECYQTALDQNRVIGNRRAEGDILGNIGLVYRKTGDFENALKHHESALGISSETGDLDSMALDYGNLGLAHHAKGDLQNAIRFYNQALDMHRRTGNKGKEFHQFLNLGDAYRDMGEIDQASNYYAKAKALGGEINYGVFDALDRSVDLFRSTDDFEKAKDHIREGIELSCKLRRSEKECVWWEKLLAQYELEGRENKKNECFLKLEALLEKLCKDSKNRTVYLEKIIRVYQKFGYGEKAAKCQKQFSELGGRSFYMWLDANTIRKVENNLPILPVGRRTEFHVKIGKPPKAFAWMVRKNIPDFSYEPVSDATEEIQTEGRRISKEHTPNKTPNIEKSSKTQTEYVAMSEITREDTGKSENIVQPTMDAIQNPPIIDVSAVLLNFEGDAIRFDESVKTIGLPDERDSDVVRVSLIPEKAGLRDILITIRNDEYDYMDSITIPLQVTWRVYCLTCLSVVPVVLYYCPICASSLERGVAVSERDIVKCPKCEREYTNILKFCPMDGQRLEILL